MEPISEPILHEYPYPIAKCYERVIRTRELAERWETLRYLFEATLKYSAAISIAQYLQAGHPDQATNASFACLSRPSLGHWLNLLRQCTRYNTQGNAFLTERDLLTRMREGKAIPQAAAALRRYFKHEQLTKAETLSPFSFAELLVTYRNRSAGHGAPDRRHLEQFTPLLEASIVEWLLHLDGLKRHPLVYVSDIRVERRQFVHRLTRLMGISQVPMPDFVCVGDDRLAVVDRALFLADVGTSAPSIRIHPLAIYANDEVFLLQRSDLDHTVEYLCHHTGATYTADHIYEDFKDQFANVFDVTSVRQDLDTATVYEGCVRMSLLDGVIAQDERAYLDDLRSRLDLSERRAAEIEDAVRRELKIAAPIPVTEPKVESADNLLRLVEEQNTILRQIGSEILVYICRQQDPSQPIKLHELASGLAATRATGSRQLSPQELARLIVDVQNHGFAPGLIKKAGGYCVAEGHIAFKVTRELNVKRAIARGAVQFVSSGARIGLDGGSTTLPIAEELVSLLDTEALEDLTIVTNSLPVAQKFADFVERRGWSDADTPVRILLAAGLVRAVTKALAETTVGTTIARDSLAALVQQIGGLDCCFVGANGITAADGITMPTTNELHMKRFFLETAARPVIVADLSKFGQKHAHLIAGWSEALTLLTNEPFETNQEVEGILALERRVDVVFAPSTE
jgi:DeoR/GlpR family transcriptional regulator of sugar metabolism